MIHCGGGGGGNGGGNSTGRGGSRMSTEGEQRECVGWCRGPRSSTSPMQRIA